MNTDRYIHFRTGSLNKVRQAIQDEKNRSMVIDKLNLINNNEQTPLLVEGVYTSTYPATFTVRESDQEREVEVWVKETRVNYDTPIPYLILNEGKVLQEVIRDMFMKKRSPHFSFPVSQIITNDQQGLGAHISIYTLTEYLPYPTLVDYISSYDPRDPASKFSLISGVFQIMYNLSLMESLQLQHNDLHPRNIKINTDQLFLANYVLDKETSYKVPSTCFITFLGWERSQINTREYFSIPFPQEDFSESWNPYKDMKQLWTVLLTMMGKKTDMLQTLFGRDPTIQRDLERLVREPDFEDESYLPTKLTIRFANQFFSPGEVNSKDSEIVFSIL
jgi:serine/threonine protein kinase